MKTTTKLVLALAVASVWHEAPALPRNSRPDYAGRAALQQRKVEFTYVVHVPELTGGTHQMRIWIPIPQSGAHQRITGMRITSPAPYRITTETKYGNRSAYFNFSRAQARGPFDIRMTFRARRYEFKVELPSRDPKTSRSFPEDARQFLLPDRLVPIDGVIGELSREQTAGISDPLRKARAIYEYVLRNMHYDHAGTGWGRGDAVWACSSHHGNCTDFHSLFIGMARAAGIPARFDIGFPLPVASSGGISGYHCWAEFYVAGTGWIPVDAAEASQEPAKLGYYFGAVDQNRVRFSRGRDLKMNPPQSGETVNYFVYPYAEEDGKSFSGIKVEFAFRDLSEREK